MWVCSSNWTPIVGLQNRVLYRSITLLIKFASMKIESFGYRTFAVFNVCLANFLLFLSYGHIMQLLCVYQSYCRNEQLSVIFNLWHNLVIRKIEKLIFYAVNAFDSFYCKLKLWKYIDNSKTITNERLAPIKNCYRCPVFSFSNYFTWLCFASKCTKPYYRYLKRIGCSYLNRSASW